MSKKKALQQVQAVFQDLQKLVPYDLTKSVEIEDRRFCCRWRGTDRRSRRCEEREVWTFRCLHLQPPPASFLILVTATLSHP
jgi:hypothetical protein